MNDIAMTRLFDDFVTGAGELWQGYLHHPWMDAIHDGTLTRRRFAFFLAQDMPYQRDFLNALVLAASKAADPQTLLNMRSFIADEAAFEESLLAELQTSWSYDRWSAGPAREGYMNHLIRVAHEEDVSTICAALLPCAAGFTGAMAERAPKAGLDPLFVRWLEYYERPSQFEFSNALVDTFELGLQEASKWRVDHARMIFTRSVQHQLNALDAAWRTADLWCGSRE